MSLCRICEKPSMVMKVGSSAKVQFKPARDAKSFVCGLCVAFGRWPEAENPGEKKFDLKAWRKRHKLTQEEVAIMLQTKREAISMVERGHRLMPKSWESKLLQAIKKKKAKIHPSYNVTRTPLDLKWVKM